MVSFDGARGGRISSSKVHVATTKRKIWQGVFGSDFRGKQEGQACCKTTLDNRLSTGSRRHGGYPGGVKPR